MEPPATFEADALRDEKVKVLRAIGTHPAEPLDDVVRGQYGPGWVAATPVPGYRQEADVDPKSETETFVAARLDIDDWRWSGVPFYVRTGKRLPKRATEIAIQFREVPAPPVPRRRRRARRRTCWRSGSSPTRGSCCGSGPRCPGLGLDVRPVTMDFTYGSAFSVDSPDAYETLILDALQGDASLFTRADEVEEAWGIVDPIIDAWATTARPGLPELRRRHVGARRGRRAARPRGPAMAADLSGDRHPMAIATASTLNEPVLRWSARAHSIAEIEQELARIWAKQDLDDRRSTAASRAATSRPGRA